ncbi:MAG: M14 family zinc carboxypeptidase [Planctomycetota bacterium]
MHPALLISLPLYELFLASSLILPQDPGTSYRFRVDLRASPEAIWKLRGFDVLGACNTDLQKFAAARSLDVIVLPEELARFRGLGLQSTLVDRGRPFAEILAERRKYGPLPDPNYFTVAEIEAELSRLQTQFSKIALRVDLNKLTGTSLTHQNKRIYALKISDNVQRDEDEPALLMASQHHARELNTPYMVIQAARRILAGYPTDPLIKKVVEKNELWLVPCMNPDGVDYVWARDNYWRKNRRNNGTSFGVDQNRNYPFDWGKCGNTSSIPSSQVYRGPSAGSEPETRTIMALARLERFEKYLDFHSYGREVLTTTSSCHYRAYGTGPWVAMETRFRTALATSLGYRTRFPSASGEAPEWHFAENGSLSYLVEVGTSFQPVFSLTVSEERRVWPGVRAWLALEPAIRGHVRSLKSSSPLQGSLDPRVLGFKFGERSRSCAGSGRYHLWLPPGKSTVAVSAAGHQTRSFDLTAPAYGSTVLAELVLIPNLPPAALSGPVQHSLGKTANLVFSANDPGRSFWIPMALGTSPGIRVGPRVVPLTPDPIFAASALSMAPIYSGQIGTLDASGRATARFFFPNVPLFIGFKLSFCGLTLEPGYPFDVKAITAPLTMTLTR